MLVVWIKMVPVVGEKELGSSYISEGRLSVTDDCMWRIRKRQELRIVWVIKMELPSVQKNVEQVLMGKIRVHLWSCWIWSCILKISKWESHINSWLLSWEVWETDRGWEINLGVENTEVELIKATRLGWAHRESECRHTREENQGPSFRASSLKKLSGSRRTNRGSWKGSWQKQNQESVL